MPPTAQCMHLVVERKKKRTSILPVPNYSSTPFDVVGLKGKVEERKEEMEKEEGKEKRKGQIHLIRSSEVGQRIKDSLRCH